MQKYIFITTLLLNCSIIYDKIDKDANGQITETELRDWIKYVKHHALEDAIHRQWEELEIKIDNTLTWDNYKNWRRRTYGFIGG